MISRPEHYHKIRIGYKYRFLGATPPPKSEALGVGAATCDQSLQVILMQPPVLGALHTPNIFILVLIICFFSQDSNVILTLSWEAYENLLGLFQKS